MPPPVQPAGPVPGVGAVEGVQHPGEVAVVGRTHLAVGVKGGGSRRLDLMVVVMGLGGPQPGQVQPGMVAGIQGIGGSG